MHVSLLLPSRLALWVALAGAGAPTGSPGPPPEGWRGPGSAGPSDPPSRREEPHASLSDLERDLRAPRPETRRVAVRKLAARGERRAFDLLLGALEDHESMVADEAQLALGEVRDPRLAARLLGPAGLRSKERWVRLRVAEALGRLPVAVDAGELARGLPLGDAREAEIARAILWSIERLARARCVGGDVGRAYRAAERVARSRGDAELRGAALQAMHAIAPLEARSTVRAWLEEADGTLRCAALLAVGTWTEQECLTVSSRLLDDPDACVRAQAIENLQAQTSRAAMLALVRRLGIEDRERLRWWILAFLRARSGEDHGFDVEAWKGWAGRIEGRLATGEGRGPRLGPMGGTGVSFAGMNLVSDRVCFLIDFSGSTWQSKVGDRSRKEILEEELRRALEALPEGTRFNVIPYTDEPIPWQDRLAPSDRASVRRAIEFFEGCNRSGRGNFFDAAMLALEDPDVDTITVLTDGVPTGGRRWHLELMVELLVERDRFRKVAFDSILVDAPWSKRRLWEELARRTGGRSVEARLDRRAPGVPGDR